MSASGHGRDGLAPVLAQAQEHLACDRSAIAVLDSAGAPRTVAVSDETRSDADRLQSAHVEGPAATSIWPTPQMVLDLDEPGPWPDWTRGLTEHGVVRVLTTQLVTDDGTTGALTLYYGRRTGFSAAELALASVLAGYAASKLRYLRLLDHLHHAVEGRTWIGQAQGILMAQYGLEAEQAFTVLQRHSQDTNTKLRDVARGLVRSGRLDDYSVRHQV